MTKMKIWQEWKYDKNEEMKKYDRNEEMKQKITIIKKWHKWWNYKYEEMTLMTTLRFLT